MVFRRMAVIGLLSMALVSLELIWTRLFSAEYFYTFAFLVLSLAVLGLGLGALLLHLARPLQQERHLAGLLSLTALAALAGPPLVTMLGLDFTRLFSWAMGGRIILAVVLMSGAWSFGGAALALLFRLGHSRLDRLYMADLLGAGAGVLGGVLMMNLVGTPLALFLAPVPVLLAALLEGRGWSRAVPALLALSIPVFGVQATDLLERQRSERAPVVYTHWDAVAKIKIYSYGEHPFRGLNIDNVANSTVYGFDGDWDDPERTPFRFGIDVGWLVGRMDACAFLSLGAGGGGDVLQALQHGCGEVHAVEVVPHVNQLMTEGDLADFSGRIYHDPRVTVATEDARAYVRRHPGRFDVIYSLSSNTWAALTSGAFALAENYLFTTDAYRDYWRALSDDGYLMMEHQFYMPRLVAEALEALEAEGIEDPASHLAVYALPAMRRQMMLLSKRPLTDEVRNLAFGELSEERADQIHLLYPAPPGHENNLIDRIVREGWRAASADTPLDLSPCGDDRPYTPQLGLWKNFAWERLEKISPLGEVMGFPLSKLLMVLILAVVAGIVLPLNLLPLLVAGPGLRPASWAFFLGIGMAYMAIEVVLVHKYTLLVGPSAYALATVLMTLLVASGLGSRISRSVSPHIAFGGIALFLLLDALASPLLIDALGGMPPALRIAAASLLIAPLGLFMGMPFPRAAIRVKEAVPWGLAVNGAGSVLGATLAVLAAIHFGFRLTLLACLGLYLLAWLLFASGRWTTEAA